MPKFKTIAGHKSILKSLKDPILEALTKLKGVKKSGRYKAIRIYREGTWFDSKSEYARWLALKGYMCHGLITNLQRQVVFLYPSESGTRRYIADFVYVMQGKKYIEDVKSPELLADFMAKAQSVQELYDISVTPVHPKNVMASPLLVHNHGLKFFRKRRKQNEQSA